MIAWLLIFTQAALAISNDPSFIVSPKERDLYAKLAAQSVVAVESESPRRLCSGTLVSKNKILTSAHCFDPVNGEVPQFRVHLMNDVLTISKSIRVKSVEVHPLWLMGQAALEKWNNSLRSLYSEIARISANSPEQCRLRSVDWNQADLPVYLQDIEKFERELRQKPGVCQTAVIKIGRVMKRHRPMLDKFLISEKLARPGDLAVAELESEIPGNFHQPMDIDYNYEPQPSDNRIAFISGFGFTANGQKFEELPRVLNIGYSGFHGMKDEEFMNVHGAAVICSGDSGGPTAYVQHGRMKLVGVNAATDTCDFREGKGLSISIRANAEWLREIIASD